MYNGYPNYETWSVALIIDNDSNETIEEACRHSLESDGAAVLKAWVEEWPEIDAVINQSSEYPHTYGYLASQLLAAALSEVDWTYLAKSYREQAAEYGLTDDDDADGQ